MGDQQRTVMEDQQRRMIMVYPLVAQPVSLTSNRPPTTNATTATSSTRSTTTTTAQHQTTGPHTTTSLPTLMGDQEGMVMGYPLVLHAVSLSSNSASTTIATATTSSTRSTTTTTSHHQTTRPHTRVSQPTTKSDRKRRECLPISCIIINVALVSVLIVSLLQCSRPKFRVNSVIVNPFNISSSHITANWDIAFSIKNPNIQNEFRFEDMRVSVFYKETYISSTMMENFELKAWGSAETTKRSLQANIGVSSLPINSSVADTIAAEWSHGVVIFNVTVNAKVRGSCGLKSMTVSCKEIRVGFLPNMAVGRMLGGSRKCHVSW